MGGFVAAFVGVTMLGIVGLSDSGHPNAQWHVASMVFANVGLMLLSVTAFLHGSSQQAQKSPEMWRVICLPFHARSSRLHVIMLALPVLAVTAGVLLAVGTSLLVPSMFSPPTPKIIVAGTFYGAFILVAGWTVRDTTRFLYQYARDQADAAGRAQTEATMAQLLALQAQLNPHFLFNALNTVASLVRTDPRSAEATVENLAQVLRRTLDRSRRQLCTVREEIDYLQAYLSVERTRFGKRLRINWAVDAETCDLPVPPMTLQPLVENALKHGIGARIAGGTVRIVARMDGPELRLEVADDGVGFTEDHTEGTGLRNLRERLQTMYGPGARLEVGSNGIGARVSLNLPAAVSGISDSSSIDEPAAISTSTS